MVGGSEILLILLAILVLFGADKLPEFAKGLGKGMREFKKATDDIRREITESTSGIKEDLTSIQSDIHKNIQDLQSNIQEKIQDIKSTIEVNPENPEKPSISDMSPYQNIDVKTSGSIEHNKG